MAKKLISDIERFLNSISVKEDGCWEWQKVLDLDGYGFFRVGSHVDGSRKQLRSHRWSYEHHVGPIPGGMQIDHLCRNRACVNPAHLEPVTGRVNTQRGWRANKMHCPKGHPYAGENLKLNKRTGARICRICERAAGRNHYRKTDGAAQKKYAADNREKRTQAMRDRRASMSPEQKQAQLARARLTDAKRYARRRAAKETGAIATGG